jgi:endo-1,4-beta-xylanase
LLFSFEKSFIYLLQGKVLHWDINNEMLHGNFFTEKTGNNDVRIEMFQKAKELDPDALRFVNDYNVLLYETDG